MIAKLNLTNNGVHDTLEINLISFADCVGVFGGWSFWGTVAEFKERESKRSVPSLVTSITEKSDEGDFLYTIKDIDIIEAINFEDWALKFQVL